MKMLVCTDGSKQSRKAVEEAIKIAGGCNVNEVAVIYVYESKMVIPAWVGDEGYSITRVEIERFKKIEEQNKEKSREVLAEAKKAFAKNNIEVKTIFKEGHPRGVESVIGNRISSRAVVDHLDSLREIVVGIVLRLPEQARIGRGCTCRPWKHGSDQNQDQRPRASVPQR